MENFEILCNVGKGSYGLVMKCKHKQTKRIVAIKKIIDIKNDQYVRKMVLREIYILKKLRHKNIVRLLNVFKEKRRFYLILEYLDRTILDYLEESSNGLGEQCTKNYIHQLLCGIDYCHNKNVIHRDVKPENLLVTNKGILKLCDFGFARVINNSTSIYTEYIATRWYRAPELLIRSKNYGKPIDIWAVGCVFAELLSGDPLFAGDSDVDQLYQITKKLGKLNENGQFLISENINEKNLVMNNFYMLHKMFPSWSASCLKIIAQCLHFNPHKRPAAYQLLNDEYFKESYQELCFTSFISNTKRLSKSPVVRELFQSKPLASLHVTEQRRSSSQIISNNIEFTKNTYGYKILLSSLSKINI